VAGWSRQYAPHHPVSSLHRTGSEAWRVLRQENRHRQQAAASVALRIVYSYPGVFRALDFRHAVVFRKHRIHKREVSIQQIQHGAVVPDGILHEPYRLLEHGLAQIVREARETFSIHRVVCFETPEIEPITGELGGHPDRPLVFQHASNLRRQNILRLQIAGRCVGQQLPIGHARPQEVTEPARQSIPG